MYLVYVALLRCKNQYGQEVLWFARSGNRLAVSFILVEECKELGMETQCDQATGLSNQL